MQLSSPLPSGPYSQLDSGLLRFTAASAWLAASWLRSGWAKIGFTKKDTSEEIDD
jgi:hypothetical protein